MSLPITVRKTIDEPPTRPLTPLEKAEAEIMALRARVKELEEFKAGVNKYFSHLLNVQRDVMNGVEELGALLGKPTKSVKKNVQSV